jgi:hypothetical protein
MVSGTVSLTSIGLLVNGIVADYTPYHGKTAYEYGDHGAKDIDTDDTAPVGLSVDSCEARCDDDAACDCVAFRLSDGKCWKRADCVPAKFGADSAYDTYVKVAAPTPPPPPTPPGDWTQYKGLNCYGGRGAKDLEGGGGDCGSMSLDACQAKCDELPECVAVTYGNGKCYRRGYVLAGYCDENDEYDTWIKYTAPPATTQTPSGMSVRVAKAMGTRGYDQARLSLIRYSGEEVTATAADLEWDYSQPFNYRWTGMEVKSSVVTVTPGTSQTFTLDGISVDVKIPSRDEGSVGMYIGDPCIKSPWNSVCSQSESWDYRKILHSILGSMAVHDDLDYYVMLGDLFYDRTGDVTTQFYENFPLEAASKIMGATMGNHDFWLQGSPSGYAGDSFGNGHMQWYALDTVASLADAKQPFNFDVNPDSTQLASIENFIWYNMIGNVALLGFANAFSWEESEPHFQNMCQWVASEKPQLVVMIGHWNSEGLGCASGMDTEEVFPKIMALEGCSNLGDKLKYFVGHEHCNYKIDDGNGFLVGSFGYAGCGNFGLPILDTRNGRATLNYFPLGDNWNKVANYDEILGCIGAKGYSACTQYADVWMDQALDDTAVNSTLTAMYV